MFTAYRHKIRAWRDALRLCLPVIFRRKAHTAFLFGSPRHSNMGDQAQTICIESWLRKHFPEHHIFITHLDASSWQLLQLIRFLYEPGDRIFCHSGYHLTDLYDEETVYWRLAELFPEVPIVLFPQTIFYKNPEVARHTAEVFNAHGNITLMCRDRVSYETAQTLFSNCRLLLYPDIVTSLIGRGPAEQGERKGILFCMRNDVEAHYAPELIAKLRNELADVAVSDLTDTTLPLPGETVVQERKRLLDEMLRLFSQYRLVITDRYHGTIFSLVANTPVIVLKTADHKLSSGVAWFPDSFRDAVVYAENLDIARDEARRMLADDRRPALPPWFQQNYYEHLIDVLNHG